jgi:hypothetical protein
MDAHRINVSGVAQDDAVFSLAVNLNERNRLSAVCFVQDVTRVVIHANVAAGMVGDVWHGPVSLPRKPFSDGPLARRPQLRPYAVGLCGRGCKQRERGPRKREYERRQVYVSQHACAC